MSTRRRLAVLPLAVAAVGVYACSGPPPARLFGPTAELAPEDFPEVLQSWTRADRVYRGIENRLFVSATFHAPEFRRAFAVAFPDIYGRGGEVTRRELVELTGDVEQYHSFFLSMHTPNVKWNDLAKDDSIWRLSLVNDAGISSDAVEVISVKIDENLRAVYPYIGHFDQAYLVRFPLADPVKGILIGPDTKAFSLRIASALGIATMRWELLAAAEAAP